MDHGGEPLGEVSSPALRGTFSKSARDDVLGRGRPASTLLLSLIQERAHNDRPDACPLCFLRAAELATRQRYSTAELQLLAEPFFRTCGRDAQRQDDAAELVLQLFTLLAAEMSILDLPATAHVVEVTCMWKTQTTCTHCQHQGMA